MARIPDPRLPNLPGPFSALIAALNQYLKILQVQLNGLMSGSISASTSASSAPPGAGNKQVYAKGDFIQNIAPMQLGSAGSMYVIYGWLCISAGTPGTWVPLRIPTGN